MDATRLEKLADAMIDVIAKSAGVSRAELAAIVAAEELLKNVKAYKTAFNEEEFKQVISELEKRGISVDYEKLKKTNEADSKLRDAVREELKL